MTHNNSHRSDDIIITQHSGIYTLEARQHLHLSMDEAWQFFSRPDNLARITPPHMDFKITSKVNSKAYPGQIITYRVGVLPRIKTNWVTEITHVEEGRMFVDEQRFGPYAMWHHEHHFIRRPDGLLMIDKVSYKPPMGFLGRLVHPFLIAPQLRNIFSYRSKAIESIFESEPSFA